VVPWPSETSLCISMHNRKHNFACVDMLTVKTLIITKPFLFALVSTKTGQYTHV
jgi:hypothetical protein